jgi:DNA-binding Lrp family transcriptional regulator
MPTAYVLLNTEIGAESQVLKALKKIDGVEEAHTLWGVYDIIANIKAENMEKLRFIITNRIENIGKINSKLTMILTETPETVIQEQIMLEAQLPNNFLLVKQQPKQPLFL